MTELPIYLLDRVFDAPRNLVWKVWTNPTLLHRWYGPNVETIIHKFDLKVGGVWLNEMKWGGKSDFSKMVFEEIVPLEKLVWHHHPTDSNWTVSANAMMPDWPRDLLTTVTFADDGVATKVLLTQVPVNASNAELVCFEKFMRRMDGGWGSGYTIIDGILAELVADANKGDQT